MFARCAIAVLLATVPAAAGPSVSAQAPVSNFRLPTFTKDGHRSMLIQGAQALVGTDAIELSNLNLTLFDGSARDAVETIILSPEATAELEAGLIRGPGMVRVLRDDLEITGTNWAYDHHQKKISIAAHARITFQAQLPDILK
ncbi:MAG: hypothetical protein ACO3DQ_04975 [Cephaloticoccus sp.]